MFLISEPLVDPGGVAAATLLEEKEQDPFSIIALTIILGLGIYRLVKRHKEERDSRLALEIEQWRIQNKKQALSHIAYLIHHSSIDGHSDPIENFAIASIAQREGLTSFDLEAIPQMMDKLDFPDRQSYDLSTKVRFLKDMITISLVDSKLDNEEYKSCQDYAHAFGLHIELIDAIITEIHHKLKKT